MSTDKKYKLPKTIATQYAVKINGEIVAVRSSRKELNSYINNLQINKNITDIELVRQNITEYSIKKFKTSSQVVLVPSEVTLDLD